MPAAVAAAAAAGRGQAGRCDCRPICKLTDHRPTELEFCIGSAADCPIQAPGCLLGSTRSETVPSMQRLYAVICDVAYTPTQRDFRLNVLTFTILGLLFHC